MVEKMKSWKGPSKVQKDAIKFLKESYDVTAGD